MPRNSSAFTRLELLAVLAALALLALCTWPALAGSRGDAHRAGCFSNLRQIGQGAQRWAMDHTERIPWLTPVADGGTFTNTLRVSAVWLEMLTFSNELASPRLLACPADEGVKVASTWLGGAGRADQHWLPAELRQLFDRVAYLDGHAGFIAGGRPECSRQPCIDLWGLVCAGQFQPRRS